VGLIQREIEKQGIPTISISIVRKFTEEIKPPRAIFLHWPLGHPLGEPYNIKQQATVLKKALEALVDIKEPGTIRDLPYRWRRYEDLDK
jgi:D-proline reductase (dithiol) PrdB